MYIPSQFAIYDDDLDLLQRFTAYIELVVIHARIDYLRRQERIKNEILLGDALLEIEASLPINGEEFDFDQDKLALAFSRLNLLRQSILAMVFVEGLSAREVADKLGCSIDYVYLQKHRALKALRDWLLERGEKHGE